jgi:hypothetical protein
MGVLLDGLGTALEDAGGGEGMGVLLDAAGTALEDTGGGAAIDEGGCGEGDGGGEFDVAGCEARSACAGIRIVVVPVVERVSTYVLVPSVDVLSVPIGPTIGSQALAPIGPPSWAVTVGRVFR